MNISGAGVDNFNISRALAEVAESQSDNTGLIEKVFGGYRSWTFKELDRNASAYAHGLKKMGVGRNDRAVLMVKPSMEFVCLAFALFRLGTPVILIDPGMGYYNLLRCVAYVRPTVFIGVPKAQFFRLLNPGVFGSVKRSVCVGPSFSLLGSSLAGLAKFNKGAFETPPTARDDLAAIIFTTGSTGPPKGVQYTHGVFQAQKDLIRNYYGITPDDIDQPAFPLFALFSTALGACAVIPDMNPAHPARVNPERFVNSLIEKGVTYSFGSPAIWNVVSRYCLDHGIVLEKLRLVLMAGAPVPFELIERVKRIMSPAGEIHTPYGATEALPVTSMTGSEVLEETWKNTMNGGGTCVGKPLPGNEVRIIRTCDEPIAELADAYELSPGSIGEIIVCGEIVTSVYDNNGSETELAKINDNGRVWHRMGDLGYLDEAGRLWFCGRRAHRVKAAGGEMYTIPCEAIFNEHPDVYRSALVGIKRDGELHETPVLIVEPYSRYEERALVADLAKLALANPLTRNIKHFLINESFPVDIRHNAKIFREKLAVWAQREISFEEAPAEAAGCGGDE
ncbi:MAG: AMP-binding protein [Proteobacteria bacterium]|nr:AMP-binding protein [Pseudomonadota bacterium]MBU1738192.1 AMP-binding protein [Pseudomonadota bacterium]